MTDPLSYPGVPRWVKLSGFVAILLALFVLAVLAAGSHGPGRHSPPAHARWELLVLFAVIVIAGIALNWTGRWPGWPQRPYEWAWLAFSPGMRKLVLTVHVGTSVGTVGAVATFLALSIAGLASANAETARAAYIAMDLIARLVIVPLLIAALLSGLVQAVGTTWGLFRHYWVLVKLLLTLLVAVVLLLQMEGIGHVAAAAAERSLSGTDLLGLRRSIRTHAIGGLVVLLIPVALSIFKPRGVTRHGFTAGQRAA